jgi:hypothetical protein
LTGVMLHAMLIRILLQYLTYSVTIQADFHFSAVFLHVLSQTILLTHFLQYLTDVLSHSMLIHIFLQYLTDVMSHSTLISIFCCVWQIFCHDPYCWPIFLQYLTCSVTFHANSHFSAVFDRRYVTFHSDSHFLLYLTDILSQSILLTYFSSVFDRCSVTFHADSHFSAVFDRCSVTIHDDSFCCHVYILDQLDLCNVKGLHWYWCGGVRF